jgi:hypothetical protein
VHLDPIHKCCGFVPYCSANMVCNPHAVDTGDNVAFGADGTVNMSYPLHTHYTLTIHSLYTHYTLGTVNMSYLRPVELY